MAPLFAAYTILCKSGIRSTNSGFALHSSGTKLTQAVKPQREIYYGVFPSLPCFPFHGRPQAWARGALAPPWKYYVSVH